MEIATALRQARSHLVDGSKQASAQTLGEISRSVDRSEQHSENQTAAECILEHANHLSPEDKKQVEVSVTLLPQSPPKEFISSENRNGDQSEAALNEAFINRTEFYTGSKLILQNKSSGDSEVTYTGAAILIGAWIVFSLVSLNYGLPLLQIAVLISLTTGSSENRFLALMSLFTLSIWLWTSLPNTEKRMVQDAYSAHRHMIGCDRTDKYLVQSKQSSKKSKLIKPTASEIQRCTVDNPIDENYRQFVLDMEDRGWGKYRESYD